jgi:serine/threonine protein kinase
MNKGVNEYFTRSFAQYMASETLQAGIRGSPLYMAPEMLAEGATYDAAVDLWSLGNLEHLERPDIYIDR